MPLTFQNQSPSKDETLLKRELLQHQMRMLQMLNSLSYVTTDAVLLIPRREDTDNAISVSLAYVSRSDTQVETEITNELARRITQTVQEWTEWAQKHVTPNENTPF